MSSDIVQQESQLSEIKRRLLAQRLRGKSVQGSQTQAISRDSRLEPGPLSFAQQRLWFIEQFEEARTAYNIPCGFRFSGQLQVAALERSLNEIVRRHATLRSSFMTTTGEPKTIIAPVLPVALPVKDLRNISREEREAEVTRLALQAAQQPFDLTQCPLFRWELLRVHDREHILLFTIHHIIFDGWSIDVFMQELTALYNAFSHGKSSPLPDLPIQYDDFVQWQRARLHGEALGQHLAYWATQFQGSPALLELPVDHARPARQSFRGAIHIFVIPETLIVKLKTLSQQANCTLFMTFLAAFKVLLYRYTNQQDLLVGFPVANRQHSEVAGLIGFFVNTLVLRTKLSAHTTFYELLASVRQTTLDAQAHQDMPFDLLVEELHLGRSLSYQALFQVVFALRSAAKSSLQRPGITIEQVFFHNGTAKFDLFLEMLETRQGFSGAFEYNTDLFNETTIVRMAGHFMRLLDAIVTTPEQTLSELSILTDAEKQQILVEWNATRLEYARERCVHELFEAHVARTPDAIALVFDNQQLTYQELNCRANQVAHFLQKAGVGPETLVGICVERSLDMIVGILGILKSGGAYVPLDPAYPQERLAFMLSDAHVPILLTQKKFLSKFLHHNIRIFCLDTDWKTCSQEVTSNSDSRIVPENLAYVMYTSGSTGKPKGTLISHSNLLNLIYWHQQTFHITPADQATQVAGTAFDASVWEIWPYLTAGATLHLAPHEVLESPKVLRDWLISAHITVSFVPTPLAEYLLSLEWPERTSLRIMLTGGDRLQQYPAASLPFQVMNNYGPTENTVVTTSGIVTHKNIAEKPPSIGRPIANTAVYILDAHLQLVPAGIPGELHVGGDGLARGYLNRPELTKEKFIPNPFSDDPNARLYKTGDLARYLPDGNLEFLGRLDHQVKIRGFRIELGEIESVLLQHQAIREAVVIARERDSGDKQLAAYVVAKQDRQVSVRDLRDALKNQLPDYMIPATFTFLDTLPLTPNGKVDRRALPAPDTERPESLKTFVTPRTPAEQTMADLWRTLLHIDRIGIHDNFFELGGHSLLAVKLMAEIETLFQVKLPLWRLFETPTIAGLAAAAEAEHWTGPGQPALEEQPIDPLAEALLDESIRPSPDPPPQSSIVNRQSSIFLTGATGFLGAFLLHELLQQTLADVYCLVRAASKDEGQKRIRETLQKYSIWFPALAHRIIAVPGDLTLPRFGLSGEQFDRLAKQIDMVYHSGAQVNLVYPYAMLKSANVRGTREVLRLAALNKVKPVHHVSTTAVFPVVHEDRGQSDRLSGIGTTDAMAANQDEQIPEDAPLPPFESLIVGYAQSKWIAEKMVWVAHARGIPCSIYRPARISGHSQTGVWNTDDFACRMLKGCIEMGVAPQQHIVTENWAPVDYVSQAIVHLSQKPDSRGQVFHLVNRHPLDWKFLLTWLSTLGYPLKTVAYDHWRSFLCDRASQNALTPLKTVFQSAVPIDAPPQGFAYWNTVAGLEGSPITCPRVTPALLHTYTGYFLRTGFWDAPAAGFWNASQSPGLESSACIA